MHERLVEHVLRADVERRSIAEIWRSTRVEAGRLGLSPPGYHSVLHLVRAERQRRAARRDFLLDLLGEAWAYPGPDVLDLARRAAATRRSRGM